jgi:hypothetical protein
MSSGVYPGLMPWSAEARPDAGEKKGNFMISLS